MYLRTASSRPIDAERDARPGDRLDPRGLRLAGRAERGPGQHDDADDQRGQREDAGPQRGGVPGVAVALLELRGDARSVDADLQLADERSRARRRPCRPSCRSARRRRAPRRRRRPRPGRRRRGPLLARGQVLAARSSWSRPCRAVGVLGLFRRPRCLVVLGDVHLLLVGLASVPRLGAGLVRCLGSHAAHRTDAV